MLQPVPAHDGARACRPAPLHLQLTQTAGVHATPPASRPFPPAHPRPPTHPRRLQALSFMFEYIGEMGKDYIHAVTPLLEDALMDRDLVHRQTASSVVAHMALGVAGLGCEAPLAHLLNYVWPNIFEVSPHIVQAVGNAVDGMRVALGPAAVLHYVLQVRGRQEGAGGLGRGACAWLSVCVCVCVYGGGGGNRLPSSRRRRNRPGPLG